MPLRAWARSHPLHLTLKWKQPPHWYTSRSPAVPVPMGDAIVCDVSGDATEGADPESANGEPIDGKECMEAASAGGPP